jgi:tetratricopeptide (TPR) repeat protein
MLEELELCPDTESEASQDANGDKYPDQKITTLVYENFERIYFRLGLYYLYLGQFENAEVVNSRAFEIGKSLYGEEHPSTLTMKSKLAETFLQQGRWKAAEELETATLEARKRVLGDEHPDTLTSMANLASTYVN